MQYWLLQKAVHEWFRLKLRSQCFQLLNFCRGLQSLRSVNRRSRNKLVGDSPELCPLDSNLFSDFEFAMRQNVAYTYWLPHDHPDKYLTGTAKGDQRLMEETWDHPGAVTSERIVEDICRFIPAMDAILAANGAKVPELDQRRGRRQTKPYTPPVIEAVEELMKAR
jgi:hypothetical protein